MKVVFISNYLNHHQIPFCTEMRRELGEEFCAVFTEEMERERTQMGWQAEEAKPYELRLYESAETRASAKKRIDDADVVILGSAPVALVSGRLKNHKLTFKYSERFYKKGKPLKRFPRDAVSAWLHHGRFQKYPFYMLSASAYTAGDAARFGNYKNRCYKWGYFPAVHYYDEGELFAKKNGRIPVLLWAGRFIDWKHPDDALAVAARLKQEGIAFRMNMIGTGEMEHQLREIVARQGLGDCVHLLGAMKPEQVREYMEQANIYLFTSDRGEGWGAVLNESMNSGCAVVASHAIGAVPFLMKDGENGLVYESGNVDMLCEKVKWLLEHPEEQNRMGHNAYHTMADTWNAEEAVRRLLLLIRDVQTNGASERFGDGPCSRAQRIPDAWWG